MTLAVTQAILGFHCEARWMRFAHAQLHALSLPAAAPSPGGSTGWLAINVLIASIRSA